MSVSRELIEQHRVFLVRPVLEYLNLWSPEAENLVLGTAVQESELQWIDQFSRHNATAGPAYGLCQMEKATFDDIWENFLLSRRLLSQQVQSYSYRLNGLSPPRVNELHSNACLAYAMCRVHYLRVPQPLPAADDIFAMASYWKEHYNTALGRGTVGQAAEAFGLVCQGRAL